MKFNCELDRLNTLKDGMKVVLYIDGDNVKEVMKNIYNFMDNPLEVELSIDAAEKKERLRQITHEQRKKIYALFNDINDYTGQGTDSIKQQMKNEFCKDEGYELFSLSDCKKDTAGEFIEWIVNFCFKNGVPLSENPKESFGDIENYIYMCLKNKVCAVCGSEEMTQLHHVDTIGMGNNRNKLDDSEHKKISLCYEHHQEAHTIGWETFADKYKVKGVIFNE